MQIDIHADDYGLTENTSKQIIEGINANKLNSISVMPNMVYFEEACLLWKQNMVKKQIPKLSVHLNFMEGHCLANVEQLSYLVDENGYFRLSWGDLVKYNYSFRLRSKVKKQLKLEIKAQIKRVVEAYEIDPCKELRVDSHQHTHMIPIVMEALMESMEEEKWKAEYIRISREVIFPYIRAISLWKKHEVVNTVKVLVLNFFYFCDKSLLQNNGIEDMILSGVFFSGEMSYKRVRKILPYLKKIAQTKNCNLEILFHPGKALENEMGAEFNHPGANEFYISKGREIEYNAMMHLEEV